MAVPKQVYVQKTIDLAKKVDTLVERGIGSPSLNLERWDHVCDTLADHMHAGYDEGHYTFIEKRLGTRAENLYFLRKTHPSVMGRLPHLPLEAALERGQQSDIHVPRSVWEAALRIENIVDYLKQESFAEAAALAFNLPNLMRLEEPPKMPRADSKNYHVEAKVLSVYTHPEGELISRRHLRTKIDFPSNKPRTSADAARVKSNIECRTGSQTYRHNQEFVVPVQDLDKVDITETHKKPRQGKIGDTAQMNVDIYYDSQSYTTVPVFQGAILSNEEMENFRQQQMDAESLRKIDAEPSKEFWRQVLSTIDPASNGYRLLIRELASPQDRKWYENNGLPVLETPTVLAN